jgi:hypothetical protein
MMTRFSRWFFVFCIIIQSAPSILAAEDCDCPASGPRPTVAPRVADSPRFAVPSGFAAVGTETDPYSGLPRTIRHVATGYRLILIPDGLYLVGTSQVHLAQYLRQSRIARIATIWIGEREVSRREYLGRRRGGSGAAAMTGVSWHAARAWCERHRMRLPTEDEWEVAGRGPSSLPYPWGEEWRAASSGRRDRSAFGVSGLASPPAEWCEEPLPENDGWRAVRGDFATFEARRAGLAARRGVEPHATAPSIGFRAVVDPVALR